MKNLSESDLKLYKFTNETLLYKWDPIGVSSNPEASMEYQAYVLKVFAMIKNSRSSLDIAKFLSEIEAQEMGLTLSQSTIDRNLAIAIELLGFAEKINK